MKFRKIIIITICLGLMMNFYFKVNAAEITVGINYEQDISCNFYNTDLSFFSDIYSDIGRSAALQVKDGTQIYSYFDTNLSTQYADSQALMFWVKAPAYTNPSGDLANLNIGLICGDTRWKLNQSPPANTMITFVWSSFNQVVTKPLFSQGGGVFLDIPSNFEGRVIVPLSALVKDWGTSTTMNLPGATAFNIVWEWIPLADINKMYYFDSVGFVKDVDKYIASLGVTTEQNSAFIKAIDYEQDIDCNFNNTDSGLFSSAFRETGRSAGLQTKNGSQLLSHFDSGVGDFYADSQALVFWIKTPEYANPNGDVPNLDIGLVCGDTRWMLNQNPTSDMAITYIRSSNYQKITNFLDLQYTDVFLDPPSNFEGWVIVPFNALVKDWGNSSTLDITEVTEFDITWESVPVSDMNKMYYFDSVGFTKDVNQYLVSMGIPFEKSKPLLTGIDFEKDGSSSFFNTDWNSYSTEYKELGRSICFKAKSSSQMFFYFNNSVTGQLENSQALVFWLKTPAYANPSGDLPNINIGLICGDTRWKLNQNPTSEMAVTYIRSTTNQIQTIPLISQGGVFLDAPSDFEGWVIIPLGILVKDWGSSNTLNATEATSLNLVWEWLPTADVNKTFYFDSVSFTKNTDVLLASILSPQTFDKFNLSNYGENIITNIDPLTTVKSFKTMFNPPVNVVLTFSDSNGDSLSDVETVATGSKISIAQNGITTKYDAIIYGDVTGEGNIAINDLTAIKKHLLNQQILIDTYLLAGDVNKSSDVTISDLLAIKKYLLNLRMISQEPYKPILADYILNENIWRTPAIDRNGFVFEIQTMDGTADSIYAPETVRSSIYNLKLGESKKIPCNAKADEWQNTYIFIDNGFQNPVPTTRQSALQMLQAYFNSNYIKGASHLWKAFDGNFLNQHYAAEFGADIIGAEIGCDIKGYQMSIAYTRGAAKQYGKPWFIDYSPWFNSVSVTDYSGAAIWGEASGPNKGHSISQFERSYYMSYMSGASWLIAEAGGINYFYPTLDSSGNYMLTPHGKMGQKFNAFTKNNPDIGVPYTPFGVVIDYYHGTSFGSDYAKKAFEVFPYNAGDNLTWSLIDKFFPDSWETWKRKEVGSLTNSPYGDTCDVLLQNASQEVLNSYPVITLSGDLSFSASEIIRFKNYVAQGGKLVINSAYLSSFPEFVVSGGGNRYDKPYGNGIAMIYGPNYDPAHLDTILSSLTAQFVPFSVSGHVQYIVNIKNGSMILTVINNDGVTKEADGLPLIDLSATQTINMAYRGENIVKWVKNLRTGQMLTASANQTVTIAPGDLAIYEFGF